MTYDELVAKVAQELIGDVGPMDIDTDLDRWFFTKPTSPADVVRFIFDQVGLTDSLVEQHRQDGTHEERVAAGFWNCDAHSDGVACCIDYIVNKTPVEAT